MDLVKLIKKCNAFYFGQSLGIISMIRLDAIGSTVYCIVENIGDGKHWQIWQIEQQFAKV